MSAAPKFIPQYTVSDYLGWDGDWELWSGIPVAMSPSPFGRHQAVASRVAYELRKAIVETDCQAEVLPEIDWIVSDDTVVRPDVIVSCEGIPDRHVETPPAIVVEVLSDATRERDLTFKQELYRDHGAGSYLVADPADKSIVMWLRDSDRQWLRSIPGSQIKLRVCEDCELTLDCGNLFP